jgi:hypothetical protein
MCVHLREVIIAIEIVKKVFKFRVGRCSPIGFAVLHFFIFIQETSLSNRFK